MSVDTVTGIFVLLLSDAKWQKNGAFVSESSKYWVMADSLMLRGSNRFYVLLEKKTNIWAIFVFLMYFAYGINASHT